MKIKYKLITSVDEALNWLISNYNEFINKNQRELNIENTLANALYCYTGSMSGVYNDILYKANANIEGIKLDDSMHENDYIFHADTLQNIKLIYEGFKYNQINEDIVLYHYINFTCKSLISYIRNNKNIFVLKRFISTTLLKNSYAIKRLINQNKYNILFKINVPKGTNCIPILWNSKQSNLQEFEVILEPNLKLKLIKTRKKFFSKIKYELEFNVEQ